jgi:hypothetical protein
LDLLLDGYYVKDIAVRQATPDEAALLTDLWCDVNWGVYYGGQLVALFQAEDDGDGWLNVHANVARRRLHPRLTYFYAKSFSDRLLELGAVGLKAEIKIANRAAIRIAKAAGYTEQTRNDEWVILTRVPNG